MYYDKRVKRVGYNDEKHIYQNIQTKRKYVSVTTLVGKYKTPFDEEYWSLYKTLEELVPDFKQLKHNYPDAFINIAAAMCESKDIKRVQKRIKAAWKDTRIKAARKGTKYHKKQEDKWRGSPIHNIKGKQFLRASTNMLSELENGVYPELLVYNDEYNLAGQIDLLIKEGNNIQILDFKTNKALKTSNMFQSMLYPLSHMDDCNMNHYYLQLNLYRFMVEAEGYNVTEMKIYHSITEKEFIIPRLDKEINDLLKDARNTGRLLQ